jgi:ATP-dependent Clp protease protease subunit
MLSYNFLSKLQIDLLDKNIIEIAGEIDGDTASYVHEALLRLAAKGSPDVTIRIISSGGATAPALDIYDLIRLYDGKSVGMVYSIARSMAAVILQGCTTRQIARNANLMIHNVSQRSVSLDAISNEEKIKEIRASLERTQSRINIIISERTGKSLDEIKATCSEDRDMDSEEALSFGLVDEII